MLGDGGEAICLPSRIGVTTWSCMLGEGGLGVGNMVVHTFPAKRNNCVLGAVTVDEALVAAE